MANDGNSQIESLWSACAGTIAQQWDAYGWVVPALLLTLVFFAAIGWLCWALEDLPVDVPLVKVPKWIFRRMRLIWRVRRMNRVAARFLPG